MTTYTITILGSGNLATNLAFALEKEGHILESIWSRNPENAKRLADKLNGATTVSHLDFRLSKSTIFMVAVSDIHIGSLCSQIELPDGGLLVHTAGSVPIEVFNVNPKITNFGVFYPLQTFNINQPISFKDIPLFLESNNESSRQILTSLASSISSSLHYLHSTERHRLHMAGVFSSNFTNHILYSAEKILKRDKLNIEILKPLIEKTIANIFTLGPQNALTGPASRNDIDTINSHLSLLGSDPELRQLYELITKQIIERKKSD